MKTEFKNQFWPINAEKITYNQLKNLIQSRSVQDHVSQFKFLYLQISNVSKTKMMDWFLQGLKLEVQREGKLKNPQTFEEEIRIAKKVDAIDFKNCWAQPITQSSMPLSNTMV